MLARANTTHSLTPYLRYEHIDTQAEVPAGTSADARYASDIWTIGINYKPIDQIVFKLDYASWSGQPDTVNFLIGYVF